MVEDGDSHWHSSPDDAVFASLQALVSPPAAKDETLATDRRASRRCEEAIRSNATQVEAWCVTDGVFMPAPDGAACDAPPA